MGRRDPISRLGRKRDGQAVSGENGAHRSAAPGQWLHRRHRGGSEASRSATLVPCTWSSHAGSDGSPAAARNRRRFSATAAGVIADMIAEVRGCVGRAADPGTATAAKGRDQRAPPAGAGQSASSQAALTARAPASRIAPRRLLRILAQCAEQLLEIRRHRALQDQSLDSSRMIESQRCRMQSLALERRSVSMSAGAAPRGCAKRPPYTGSPTMGYFSCDRCRRIWWVRPVSNFTRQIGMGAKALQHPVMRDRRPAPLAYRHSQPIAAVAPDGLHRWCRPPVMTPTHTARYSRDMVRAISCRLSEVCASAVRATTNRPLVSLSRRWMRPARGNFASDGSSPNRAFCKVCRGFPAPGCTTNPAGLSMTSTSASSCTSRSAIASGSTSGWPLHATVICTRIRAPASTMSRGLQLPPAHLHRARLDPPLDPGARMLRHQPRQGTVQALTSQFRRNLEVDHLELWGHRGLEATVGASGYTAALSAQGPPL